MKFSAVIFDMDGLMLDSERVYREIFTRAARDCGIEFTLELHDRMTGRNSKDTRMMLLEEWKDARLLERFWERSRCHHDECFQITPPAPKEGLHELLDFLEEKGVRKVVATSTKRLDAIPRLKNAGLLHRFTCVSTGDEVEHGKPAPDLFLLAASRIPAEPSTCLVLEDSEPGIMGACAAGMTAVMVPDLKQPCDEVRDKAAGVYSSLREVIKFLEQKF